MDKDKVRQLVDDALKEDTSLFLIDLNFFPGNKIVVTIDGDKGVPLKECIRVSRVVEGNLDREEEDFSLEVSSPDITKPLLVVRQYKKNLGKTLIVKTKDAKVQGTLVEAQEESVVLQWKTREPKPIGKGKVTVQKTETILYDNILEAKVKLIF